MTMAQQFLLGLFLVAVTTPYSLTQDGVIELSEGADDFALDNELSDVTCPFPYSLIGKKCLFFGVFTKSAHPQAYSACNAMSGTLTTIDDATTLQSIIKTIRDKGYQTNDFWIDGSREEGGNWTTNDQTSLVMGTPFWAAGEDFSKPSNSNGTARAACAALTGNYGHMMSDENCTNEFAPICEMVPTSTEAASRTDEKENISCPDFYVLVDNICLGFLTWAEETWVDSRFTCETLKGTLLSLSKIELLRSIYKHLEEKELTQHSFWIGGSDREKEGDWVWDDGLPIPKGTPFWGIKNESAPPEMLFFDSEDGDVWEPDGDTNENCLAITAAGMYYFRDKDCNIKMSPLCFTIPK